MPSRRRGPGHNNAIISHLNPNPTIKMKHQLVFIKSDQSFLPGLLFPTDEPACSNNSPVAVLVVGGCGIMSGHSIILRARMKPFKRCMPV